MPKTYFAASANTAPESWRTIRSIRADPPDQLQAVFRTSAERRTVFQTGLEQAQQQFTAAASIGYESRPLNLFYGLSQAGRALAAASYKLGPSTTAPETLEWKGNGHGLHFEPELRGADFFHTDVTLKPTTGRGPMRDLFSRVSLVLDSPIDAGRTPLAGLTSQIPEFEMEFGTLDEELPPLHPTGIYALVPQLTYPVGLDVAVPGINLTDSVTDEEILKATTRYPSLREFTVARGPDSSVLTQNPGQIRLHAHDREHLRLGAGGSYYQPAGAFTYRRHLMLFPAVGPSSEAFKPVMSWWLLLYAFSMIARYSPSSWSETLSLSTSPIASKVEFLLDTAIDAVPDLVAEALTAGA